MFSAERLINEIFDHCRAIASAGAEFNAASIIEQIDQKPKTDEERYWQKKNIVGALAILEGMKLIFGRTQPEFTRHKRFLTEVRYGQITTLGRWFAKLPSSARCLILYIYRRKKTVISALCFFSFIYLCSRAYMGAALIAGWSEYLALAIVAFFVFLGFKRLIE